MDTYSKDGVDINAGDTISAYAATKIKETWDSNPLVAVRQSHVEHFRGPRTFVVPETFKSEYYSRGLNSDGIGTKTNLHNRAKTFATAAYDLIAMLADDVVRYGGLPLVASTVLDLTSTSDRSSAYELLDGLMEAATKNKIVILSGETAELSSFVGSEELSRWDLLKLFFGLQPDRGFPFLWSGTMEGLYDERRIITGETVSKDDVVLALKEVGFRSNGISSVRSAFKSKYGSSWWKASEAEKDLEHAVYPSTCYSSFLSKLNGWPKDGEPLIQTKFIAHITGGGIISKFGSDFLKKRGLSAYLDNLFDPPEIMRRCMEWRGMSENEAYATWNCGQGALVVINKNDVRNFLDYAKEYGISARSCGVITGGEQPTLEIISKFTGDKLTYQMAA